MGSTGACIDSITHSQHYHGFAPTALNPEALLTNDPRNYFSTVWGFHITAKKPCADMPPMQVDDDQIENTPDFLTGLVRRVQTHECNAYCHRKKKGIDTIVCQFHFPFDTQE